MPLGLYALSVWFFGAILVSGVLVYGIWQRHSGGANQTEASSTTKSGYFAAIPKVSSIFGFTEGDNDKRPYVLEKFLIAQNSPMAGHAETFIRVADACPMDWALLPAIAGKESGYGRIIPRGSFNAFGWAIYSGKSSGAVFENWDHAIERVGQGLCENYIKNGRVTPAQIEQLYTPQSAQTHGGWRTHVASIMEQIKSRL